MEPDKGLHLTPEGYSTQVYVMYCRVSQQNQQSILLMAEIRAFFAHTRRVSTTEHVRWISILMFHSHLWILHEEPVAFCSRPGRGGSHGK